MAENDTSDPSKGSPSSSEAHNFTAMFKSVMNGMKELKQTVASLMEPVDEGEHEDNTEESDELEGSTAVGGKNRTLVKPAKPQRQKPPAANCSPK